MTSRSAMAAATAAALLTTGCSTKPNSQPDPVTTPGGSASAPAVGSSTAATPDAVDLLRASTTFIDHTSFRADVDVAGGQVTTVAHVDSAGKRADAKVSAAATVTEI